MTVHTVLHTIWAYPKLIDDEDIPGCLHAYQTLYPDSQEAKWNLEGEGRIWKKYMIMNEFATGMKN